MWEVYFKGSIHLKWLERISSISTLLLLDLESSGGIWLCWCISCRWFGITPESWAVSSCIVTGVMAKWLANSWSRFSSHWYIKLESTTFQQLKLIILYKFKTTLDFCESCFIFPDVCILQVDKSSSWKRYKCWNHHQQVVQSTAWTHVSVETSDMRHVSQLRVMAKAERFWKLFTEKWCWWDSSSSAGAQTERAELQGECFAKEDWGAFQQLIYWLPKKMNQFQFWGLWSRNSKTWDIRCVVLDVLAAVEVQRSAMCISVRVRTGATWQVHMPYTA